MSPRLVTLALSAGLCAMAAHAFAAEPIDRIQGNWLGDWKGQGDGGGKLVAKIYGIGGGRYQAIFTAYDSGEQDHETFSFAIAGLSVNDDRVDFTQKLNLGLLGTFDFEAGVQQKAGKLTGKYSNGGKFVGTLSLDKHVIKPETVGAKPLPGSVVLFDGKDLSAWTSPMGDLSAWVLSERVVTIPAAGQGNLSTKASFGDAQIHVEFRIPYLPEAQGDQRGNSGVVLDGLYELQIVDSFGFPRLSNSSGGYDDHDAAGSILGQRAPSEQPLLPPGEWQAYDITYTAPKRGAIGNVISPAEVTVQLNGVTIHDRVPLTEPTADAPFATAADPSAKRPGLALVNSGQPVEFRNIWYVPLSTGN